MAHCPLAIWADHETGLVSCHVFMTRLHHDLLSLQVFVQVKVICSSGGRFLRLPGGGLEYEGGETRLVSVANFCSFRSLVDSLERVAGAVTHGSSGSDRSDVVSLGLNVQ